MCQPNEMLVRRLRMRVRLGEDANHTVKSSVVGLDVSLGHLAVLDNKSVALAAGIAEDGSAVEGQVKGRCELAVRVGKEADARLASGVLRSTPGTHAESMSVMCRGGGYEVRFRCMAKKVDRSRPHQVKMASRRSDLAVASVGSISD
jgi:hypothetical protein